MKINMSREEKISIARADLLKHEVDSLLVLERNQSASVFTEIFERDGSESEACGNGAILISILLELDKGMIEMRGGTVEVASNGRRQALRVNMNGAKVRRLDGQNNCLFIKIGEPHVINIVDNIDKCNLEIIGKTMQVEFPEGINVNALARIDDACYLLRTYERGVFSETKSCGTGALASYIAIAHCNNGKHGNTIELRSIGGSHWVSQDGDTLQLEVLKECCEIRCLYR